MKIKLLMGAAIASLTAGHAWAQTGPSTEDTAGDVVIILGEGETRQVQTLTAEDLSLEAAGTSAIKLIESLPGVNYTAADPFGGTILTDWYEDAEAPGERYKVNVLILDRQLRADSLKISTFRQKKDKAGNWVDSPTDAKIGRKLEDTVLTRARELRVTQLGY